MDAVFVRKARAFNRRFLMMADHCMVEPTACTPASGWEKGRVEQQVQTVRGRLFQARLGGRLLPVVEARCPHLWLPMAEFAAARRRLGA